MMNTSTTYRHIDRYIHKYSDFLVVMISVGLASARPNYYDENDMIVQVQFTLYLFSRLTVTFAQRLRT